MTLKASEFKRATFLQIHLNPAVRSHRHPKGFPLKLRADRDYWIGEDMCPECGVGHLDTGWECLSCGFDARPEALMKEANAVGHH